MYGQDSVKPYGNDGGKSEQVERMFDNIAPAYDFMNRRLSFSIDKRWRGRAVSQLAAHSPRNILDVATGTGDFAIMAAREFPGSRVTGIDISEGMMEIGRAKAAEAGLGGDVTFQWADCLALPFADGEFDAVISSFGIRNFADLDRGLSEICRVLKSGGVASILELSHPTAFPAKQLFSAYSRLLIPLYGRIAAGDGKAYRYLSDSIAAFPKGDGVVEAMLRAGFSQASFKSLTFGACNMYYAIK